MKSKPMSRLFPFRRECAWFAVDVGSSSVKVAEAVDGRDGARVLRTAVLPAPAGAVENGFVRQTRILGDAIREFAGPARGRTRRAVASIPGRGVMLKRLRLPEQGMDGLDRVIEFEAMDAVPEDLDNVNLDYHVLGPSDDGNGLEILLVAARKDLVENYVELLETAGLVPAVVDVDHFALRSGSRGLPDRRADVLVHVGARSTTVHVPTDDLPGYTADLPVGGEQLTESLAGDLGVSRDEAEAVKCGDRSPGVARLLASPCDRFAAEVARSLNLFGALGDRTEPRRISLSGGGALLPGLGPSLARALDAEVRVCGPFFGDSLPPEDAHTGPAFAVVAGLVTRSPSE